MKILIIKLDKKTNRKIHEFEERGSPTIHTPTIKTYSMHLIKLIYKKGFAMKEGKLFETPPKLYQ